MTENTIPTGWKRFHAEVQGHVQGVGFRYATQEHASNLGLTGYVRNTWDGAVEVVAEGPEDDLQRLLSWLHRGPTMAHVSQVRVTWRAATGEFHHFKVRN